MDATQMKFNDEYSFLNDVKCTYQTTMNGQLALLMLCEDMELAGFPVISANTDGVLCKVANDRMDEYYAICKAWEAQTKLSLEYADYETFIRRDVNNYLAIKQGDSDIKYRVKTKGIFTIDKEIGYDPSMKIIPIALHRHFLNGEHVDDILRDHDEIYDFCITQNTGKQYKMEAHSLKDNQLHIEVLQKNNRFFVSNKGVSLYKRKVECNKLESLVAKQTVSLFNDYYHKDIKDYDINYNYYKRQIVAELDVIYKRVHSRNTGTKSKSGMAGSLFDELD